MFVKLPPSAISCSGIFIKKTKGYKNFPRLLQDLPKLSKKTESCLRNVKAYQDRMRLSKTAETHARPTTPFKVSLICPEPFRIHSISNLDKHLSEIYKTIQQIENPYEKGDITRQIYMMHTRRNLWTHTHNHQERMFKARTHTLTYKRNTYTNVLDKHSENT
jgi:hypothetical protein